MTVVCAQKAFAVSEGFVGGRKGPGLGLVQVSLHCHILEWNTVKP